MMAGSADGNGLQGAATASDVGPAVPAVDSAKPEPALADPAIRARYRALETLTRGPQDAVYLAQGLDTGALVELRVLPAELGADHKLLQALREQVTLVARVSSHCPAIAAAYECEQVAGGAVVLTMEHPNGPTLREVIRREGTLSLERALRLAIRIARALERAHNLSLVHGGLRPGNVVLVGPEETVVLTHFGFDRLVAPRPSATAARDGVEDSVYQAPEQAAGRTTERSDIYAFGAILYQMLAGAPPSGGRASRRLLDPKPLRKSRPDVTPTLERLIMQTLQVAPERRPVDISVIANDLWVEISSEGRPKDHTTIAGPWAATRTKRLVVSGGLAIIAALAVWLAHGRMTIQTSPASMAVAPGVVGAAGRSGAGNAVSVPTPAAPVPSATAEGPRASVSEPGKRSAPSPGRSSGPPRAVAPASASRAEQTSETPRPTATVAPRPQPSGEAREPGDDPAAIIDWLLTEGGGQRR